MLAQLCNVSRQEVRHLMILCVSPTSFNRICVRSIGRKIKRLKSRMCCDEFFYNLGCMDSGAIPDEFDIPRDLATNLSKKINHQASIEILIGRKHFEQKAFALCFRRKRNCPNRRNLVPPIPCWKDWSFATGRQRSTPGWHQLKANLIKKNQGCFVRLGFFLISGSSSESQVLTFSALRSRAIFSGRWNDQPSFSVTRRYT